MGYRGTGTRPIRFRRAPISRRLTRSLRRHRSDRRRRYLSLQRFVRMAAHRAATPPRRLTAYGIGYDLNLFSNFTFFLDDPVNGDQFHQADHRFVSGAKLSHRRSDAGRGRAVQNTFGAAAAQRRHHATSGSTTPSARVAARHVRRGRGARDQRRGLRAERDRVDAVAAHAGGPSRRRLSLSSVDADEPENGGTVRAGIVSPKGGVVLGPWNGTEFYVNAGLGFHSNDARGATITRDPVTGRPGRSGDAARAGQGRRSRACEPWRCRICRPAFALWTLALDSELVFVGDAGTTEAGTPEPPLRARMGQLLHAAAVADRSTATVAGRARSSRTTIPAGDHIPGAVATVVSAGATSTACATSSAAPAAILRTAAALEDNSVRSERPAWSIWRPAIDSQAQCELLSMSSICSTPRTSDIDYFYALDCPASRAPASRTSTSSHAATYRPREFDRWLLTPPTTGAAL